jgi:type IV pilus modification protein PilV
MQAHGVRFAPANQAGFSMVEMLMAAFILAIGILGLTMLQSLSLRASRGSASRTTAILIANRVMDAIYTDARNSVLWKQNGADPTNPSGLLVGGVTQQYDNSGNLAATSGAPVIYNVVTGLTAEATPVGADYVGYGSMGLFTVTVAWTDGVDSKQNPIPRNVSITRRMNYYVKTS